MSIYKLTTNERTIYVRSTNDRLSRAMFEYIRKKRAAGVALTDIIFTWHQIYPTTI